MLSWGDGAGGQLGRNLNALIITTPAVVRGVVISEEITKIACGEQHTLLLDERGSIASCGSNSKGQLGRQTDKDSQLTLPVEGLEGVVSMACGQAHSLSLDAKGQVFSWGAGEEGQLGIQPVVSKVHRPRHVPILSPHTFTIGLGPIPSPLLPIPVRQVACGNFHSLALTKGGEVFSWGLNSHGQLGLGKEIKVQAVPAIVRSLTGVPVTQISAGGAHTLVLTLPGLVYCCGANQAGQLGLNRVDEKGRFNIRDVPALKPLDVSLISCGAAHSAVLTKNGRVFTFGEGSSGQLGHNSTDNELKPKLVEGMEGLASQVACGSQHTLVLGTSGQLWAFGSGVKGQLGTGSTEDSLQPTLVQLPWVSGGAEIPDDLKIAAGWNSNFVYMTDAMVFEVEKPIGICEKAQLQKWITTGDRGPAQREISLMFSTCSNLVASFTKDRESSGDLRVDVEAASQAFEQLLNTEWIRMAVTIIPPVRQLVDSSDVMKSPEIFVILPTCPLLREDDCVMNMVLPLAKAILGLSCSNMGTLRDWWSTMEPATMTKHILVWKQALSYMLKNNLLGTHMLQVKSLLQVLKHLHRANKRAVKSRKVPDSTFYVDEIFTHGIMQGDVQLWRVWPKDEDGDDTPPIFCRYPFLLNLLSKITVFNAEAEVRKFSHRVTHEMSLSGPPEDITEAVFHLKLRRPFLIEDTFRQLISAEDSAYQRELVVQFLEDMKLTLVNNKDFFLHVFEKLLAPDSGMFMYNDTKTMVWFPAKPGLGERQYFLFGVLCGIALYNHNIVHLPFPLALFKKLVDVKPSLDDMREFDPVVGNSLQYLLDYTDDDVEANLLMTFSVLWDGITVELDPEEPGKKVTSTNKKKFVDAYVNHAFNKSVVRVFDTFRRGFFKVCDMEVVKFFQPEELRGVVVGKEDYDWEKLKQNTEYVPVYHAEHPNIIMFWEVFEELTADQKKDFLLFLTGCRRVPILGMDTIKMKVVVLPDATEQHFPESLTCHSLLQLPIYHSLETLRAKLVEAVNHNRGFWRE